MSEPTTTAGICATAGALCIPLLAQVGLHPVSMISGLIGVIIVQIFLGDPDIGWKRLVRITVASVLFASVSTAIAAPIALKLFESYPAINAEAARAGTAVFLGGFAQPAILWLRQRFFGGAPAAPVAKEPTDA